MTPRTEAQAQAAPRRDATPAPRLREGPARIPARRAAAQHGRRRVKSRAGAANCAASSVLPPVSPQRVAGSGADVCKHV